MSTYKELRAQIDQLKAKAHIAREAELESVIADIRAKLVAYDLTARDIFPRRPGRPKKDRGQLSIAKYRDPKTGTTWSGRGRAPDWIRNARNRDAFLVVD